MNKKLIKAIYQAEKVGCMSGYTAKELVELIHEEEILLHGVDISSEINDKTILTLCEKHADKTIKTTIDFKEGAIKEALLNLGWKPPVDEKAIKNSIYEADKLTKVMIECKNLKERESEYQFIISELQSALLKVQGYIPKGRDSCFLDNLAVDKALKLAKSVILNNEEKQNDR